MTGLYVLFLPSFTIDRVQEDVYLGIPYQYLEKGEFVLNGNDPFAEMGPQAVYPPAWLLLKTGSLKAVRYYQLLFSLFAMALLYRKLRTHFNQSFKRSVLTILLMTSTWASMPLAMIYPTQTNGMIAGFCCVLVGLVILETHPLLAMLAFGFAYSFKGQFLAFFPGLMVYFCFFDQRHSFGWKWLVQLILAAALYFIPSSLIVPLLAQALGMFEKPGDFTTYALQGPDLLRHQVTHVMDSVIGNPLGPDEAKAALRAAECRTTEYKGYGLLAWGHIALSVGFCVSYLAYAIWRTARAGIGKFSGLNTSLVLVSIVGTLYWVNFLFVYGYPYWYNVFAVLFFNIFLVSAGVLWITEHGARVLGKSAQRAIVVLAVVGSIALIGKEVVRYRKIGPVGNSLAPHPWMKK